MTETERDMTERHVRDGRHHLARQREVVARLRGAGHDETMARELLLTLEVSQRQHEEHLARLVTRDLLECIPQTPADPSDELR